MNVILVSLDTTRADRLSCYGHFRKTSPHIDRLAEEGVLFAEHFSPHIPTFPGHTTMMTGKDLYAHQVSNQSHQPGIQPGIKMLAEILKENGYFTVAADNLGKWFARGFDHIENYAWDSTKPESWRKGEAVTKASLKALKAASEQDKPFFLFLHYWDPHTPYLPPAPFDRMFYTGNEKDPRNESMNELWKFEAFNRYFAEWMPGVTDVEFPKAQYDAEIAYMDVCFSHVLTRLDELGLTGETLIVVTADHGEDLDEHEHWFDHHGLYDTNVHIPLIMRCPELLPAGIKIHGLTSMLDLTPTILDLLDFGELALSEGMNGTSLVPLINSPSGTSRGSTDALHLTENTWMKKRGIRTHRWKMIVPLEIPDLHGASEIELYDLFADPGELNNVSLERPDIIATLSDLMEVHVQCRLKETGLPDPLLNQQIALRKIGSVEVAILAHNPNAENEPTQNERLDEKIDTGDFIGYVRDF